MSGFVDRRIGHFRIDADIILRNPPLARQALAGIIVVRCERLGYEDTYDYFGIGETFDQVPECNAPTDYRAICERLPDGTDRFMRWERSDAG